MAQFQPSSNLQCIFPFEKDQVCLNNGMSGETDVICLATFFWLYQELIFLGILSFLVYSLFFTPLSLLIILSLFSLFTFHCPLVFLSVFLIS